MCGHPNEKAKQPTGVKEFFTIVLVGGMFYWLAGGGMDKQVASNIQNIENKVETDAVSQYTIAKRQGDPIQICVQGTVDPSVKTIMHRV